MKPIKGTKGRRPKPKSKAGRRAAQAKAAPRRSLKDRGSQSRAETKRKAARSKVETGGEKPAAALLPKRPGRRSGPLRPILPSGPPELVPGPFVPGREGIHRDRESIVAIVGRPNVGKSTLFNRLTASRRSIVGDEPGITRDRIYGEMEWLGRRAILVDTGGILPDDKALIPAEIFRQARVAIEEARFIIMVVDGRAPLTATDYDLARLLLASGKPILLAINKVENDQIELDSSEYQRLRIAAVLPVSAEHALGIGDLLEHVFAALPPQAQPEAGLETSSQIQAEVHPASQPEAPADGFSPAEASPHLPVGEDGAEPLHRTHGEYHQRETSIAIIGRPNVGKSTLLNAITGSSRAIVSPVAGTTRDAVDEFVDYKGARLRFVDTAGIRRKGKTKQMAEKLSVVMARRHLEAADVALLILDATEGVTSSDATIGGYAHESGRSVILVVNKWDLVTTGRTDGKPPADQAIFERQLRNVLKYLAYAPVIFISAAQEKNIGKLLELVQQVAAERRKRISTGQMNRFLEQVDFERATVPAAKKVRIFYMTQAAVAPPTFVLFTNRKVKLHFAFERFLENQVRAAFGFRGSPIWFKVRARNEKAAR